MIWTLILPPPLLIPLPNAVRIWSRINGSASAKEANNPVGELTWAILITLELAALAVVPRKIIGPAIAVAPRSLITSRRRHNLLAEFAGPICWRHIYAPSLEIGHFVSQVPQSLSESRALAVRIPCAAEAGGPPVRQEQPDSLVNGGHPGGCGRGRR